jgi:hypothetical protein
MADDRKPDSSTLEWYVNWLAERYPDWTEEVRLSLATDFAIQQLPPVRKTDEFGEPDTTEEELTRAEQRKRARLTGKELMDILKERTNEQLGVQAARHKHAGADLSKLCGRG